MDSATFSHFPSWRSAPARLLVLLLSSSLAVQCFFCCYSLSPGNQWTVVCVPRLRFVSISLSPILFPFHCTCAVPKLLPARTQCLCWKRKSRIRSCLKPGVRGKRELLTAHLGSWSVSWPCCHTGALGSEESSTEACNTSLFFIYIFSSLNLQSRWRKWPGPVMASSDPSSHGRSHTELCQQVALAAGYSQSLSPELTAAFGFLQHKMDDIYANPPSLRSLCCLPTPSPSPSFPMCTEIGCASVLCGSVTGPLARLLSNALSWFLFTWATGTAVLGWGD